MCPQSGKVTAVNCRITDEARSENLKTPPLLRGGVLSAKLNCQNFSLPDGHIQIHSLSQGVLEALTIGHVIVGAVVKFTFLAVSQFQGKSPLHLSAAKRSGNPGTLFAIIRIGGTHSQFL